jgi:hypothetical protein
MFLTMYRVLKALEFTVNWHSNTFLPGVGGVCNPDSQLPLASNIQRLTSGRFYEKEKPR